MAHFHPTTVVMVAGALLAAAATSQGAGPTMPDPFAAPVRLTAGEAFLGHKRHFPSPVFHDANGDGLLDIVVGDLRGRLTVALRVPGKGPLQFAAETKMLAADGKEIDFHNW